MKIVTTTQWKEGMAFQGSARGLSVTMDAKSPLGKDSGMTPKELVAIGLAGCTAMDVAALMRKYKQPMEAFEVQAEAIPTESGHPQTFQEVALRFQLKGALDKEKVLEAIQLSQTKYCGVSAMISKAAPIHYVVELNGEEIGRGEAHF